MHSGKLKNSKRLQKTLLALKIGAKTTREISAVTGSLCVHSDIAALRDNGVNISKAKYVGRSLDGSKIYQYEID